MNDRHWNPFNESENLVANGMDILRLLLSRVECLYNTYNFINYTYLVNLSTYCGSYVSYLSSMTLKKVSDQSVRR